VSRLLLTWLVLLTILTVACGGGSNTTSNNTSNNPPATGNPPPPPSNPGPQNLGAPNVITVSAGATAGGADITVAAPVSNPAINALNLGTSAAGFASNTGVMVSRGSTPGIILFGPGITGDLSVTLSGPADITVSNPRTIKSTNGTSGIAFDVNIPANAAPGARTVFLRSSNNDITAFTGGLEIQ
jgi:hypothetical protein